MDFIDYCIRFCLYFFVCLYIMAFFHSVKNIMKLSAVAESLWGSRSRVIWLFLMAIVLLFSFLGAKEIWTQEHRWADIVSGMFYRHDFFHPYLGETRYYDKPLLSYWLMALFAWVSNGLSLWALRLPSVLAALLAIGSIYQIGKVQRGKSFGLLCGWMLVSTFYFVFWARVSSADMLNVGGILCALAWYVSRKNCAGFFDYSVFFIIVALTSLCKGLGGAIVPLIAVFVDMCLHRSFKQHLTRVLFLALIPGLLVYLLPFWLSSHFGGDTYGENGLYLVYKENILRYFQPFDHKDPVYTYLIYLPIYLMPWTLFFIPALIALPKRWQGLSLDAKWNVWSLVLIFLFFTLSGSRRSYYVLPIVPFAVLVTADWIMALPASAAIRQRLTAICVLISCITIFALMDAAPAWYYARYGAERFALALKHEAEKQKPWSAWNVVMLDAETKLIFYLQLPPDTKFVGAEGDRTKQEEADLLKRWPDVTHPAPNTIIISRKLYAPVLDKALPGYRKISLPAESALPFIKHNEADMPVAYIPS
jgi:4-amino-4-deoxy-L-arabinose transferase-like glycosyltransferase